MYWELKQNGRRQGYIYVRLLQSQGAGISGHPETDQGGLSHPKAEAIFKQRLLLRYHTLRCDSEKYPGRSICRVAPGHTYYMIHPLNG